MHPHVSLEVRSPTYSTGLTPTNVDCCIVDGVLVEALHVVVSKILTHLYTATV